MKNFYKPLIFTLILLTSSANLLLTQTFDTIPAGLTGVSQSSVAWGDYDNDGDLDILLTGQNGGNSVSKIYKNNGGNNFTEQSSISLTGISVGSVAWGDYDNDSDLDILLTGFEYNNPVSKIYKNNGDNIFSEQPGLFLTAVYNSSVAWGDYDNDGDIDILLTGNDKSGSSVSIIYKNNGDESFTEQTGICLTGVRRASIDWGDYDNDGDLDILLTGTANYNFAENISKIYKNNGDNTFTEQTSILLNDVTYSSVAWGDYDNDGNLDILLTGTTNGYFSGNVSKIYRNNGDNTFTEQTSITLTAVSRSSVAWGDYDNDGNLDIFLAGLGHEESISKIYKNNGDNTFTEQTEILLQGVSQCSVVWGDYDNDGDLDILLTGYDENSNSISKIYRNNSSISNSIPIIPTNLISTVTGNQVSLSWNKSSDQESHEESLTYNLYLYKPGVNFISSPHADTTNGFRKIVKRGDIRDTSYIIQNLDTGTYFWSIQAIDQVFAGSDFASEGSFTISFSNSITPIEDQVLTPNEDGIPLIVSETETADSRQWKYSHFPGGPYNQTLDGETSISITPNFAEFATYHIVCVSVKDGISVTSNEVIIKVPQFTEQTGISLIGVENSSVAWGDYNNDNFLDILITGAGYSTIYKNNGDNTFTEQTGIVLTGVYYGSAAWGDYDNDGNLDILLTGSTVGSPSGNITKIYRNNGNNTFSEQTGMSLIAVSQSSIAWSDIDKDGDLDCVLTGKDRNGEALTKIYMNVNHLFFEADINLRGGQNLAIADYNNDNYPDILITGRDINGNNITTLYKNNYDNTFIEQTDISLPAADLGTINWGDYDNDGNLDILITGRSDEGTISKIYKNNGNDTFTEQTDISLTGVSGGSATWGDYDNDGNLDILITGRSDEGTISKIYKNNGDNTFAEQTSISLSTVYVGVAAWGDYDNDGDLDILLTGNSTSGNISKIYKNNNLVKNTNPEVPVNLQYEISVDKVRLYWNQASDTETPSQSISYNVKIRRADGHYIVLPMCDTVTGYNRIPCFGNTFLNNEFLLTKLDTGTYYWSVQSVDNSSLTSDFSEEQSFKILPLFLEQRQISLTKVSSCSVAWGDYDNDGNLDILLTGHDENYNYISKIYKNNGNNTFTEQTNISLTGVSSGFVAWGDYDNDGNLDILLTGKIASYECVSKIYRNNGNYTFAEQTDISLTGVFNGSAAWGDYDNDGDLDILLTGADFEIGLVYISKIYRNNGDNTFTEQTGVSLTGARYSSVAWGDYDNDGDLDILLTGTTNGYSSGNISKIYRNNGDNTFTEQTSIPLTAVSRSSVAWGDYDNDGDLDILLTGTDAGDNKVTNVYRNDGSSIFKNIGVDIRKVSRSSVGWGDYDNDGYLDILISGNSGSGITKLYHNDQNGTFSEIHVNLTGITSSSVAWGDYDNDGDLDILITGYSDGEGEISKIYKNNTNSPNDSFTVPENLQHELSGFDMKLSWDNAINQDCPEGSLYYNLRIGTSSGTQGIMTAMTNLTNGIRNIPAIGNAQCNTYWHIKNLIPGTYYWSVQAIDQSFTGGAWATEQSFEIPNLSADFNANTVCSGASTIFTDNSLSQGENITNWNWDFGDDNTSSVQNPEHLYSTSGTYTVSLTISSASYSHSITKDIVVKPSPSAYFVVDTVCQGGTSTFLNYSQTYGVNVESWLWDLGDNNLETIQGPITHIYSDPDIYTVKLLVVADNGCIDSITENAVVEKLPSELISYDGNQCYYESALLSVEQVELYEYQWYYNNVLIEGATEYSIHPEQDGTYKVDIIPVSCNMVSPSYNLNYTDGPAVPEMYLRGPVVWYIACSNTTATTYKWYKNGTEIPNSNKQIIVPNPADGSYYVELNDGGECWTKSETVVIPDDFYSGKFKSFEELADLQDVETGMALFPNPGNGKFTLLFKDEFEGKIYIKVKDLNGKTLRQYYSNKTQEVYLEEMDLSSFESGIYFIEMNFNNKKETSKVVLE